MTPSTRRRAAIYARVSTELCSAPGAQLATATVRVASHPSGRS